MHRHSGFGIERSSGYGHHSGGGHGHSPGHSGHSGHNSGAYGYKYQCCPLVIDTWCLATILASIAGAAVFLSWVIQIEIMDGRRKWTLPFKSCSLEGKLAHQKKGRTMHMHTGPLRNRELLASANDDELDHALFFTTLMVGHPNP